MRTREKSVANIGLNKSLVFQRAIIAPVSCTPVYNDISIAA